MDNKAFAENYLDTFTPLLKNPTILENLVTLKSWLLDIQTSGKKVIVAGNGASAAISSHVSVDFTKQGGVRAINFNEADLITCFANDYGYEHWVEKAIELYADSGDLVILISSSGKSPNIVNGLNTAKKLGLKTVGCSGFESTNPLNSGCDLGFWVDSRAYNVIENIHQIWLLTACDMVIGKAEYAVA